MNLISREKLAKMIDHTNLNQIAGVRDIEKLCTEAKKYGFASVCVNPFFVPLAKNLLSETDVKICTVVGFPLGATTTAAKSIEAANAIYLGADEIDMVMNVGSAVEQRYNDVQLDIVGVVATCREAAFKCNKSVIIKVILETCYLDDSTIFSCCQCAKKCGADFVKTSTGFAILKDKAGNFLPNGATEKAVGIMKKAVGDSLGIKASGGIRSVQDALKMIGAGATRIGTSSGVKIIEEL